MLHGGEIIRRYGMDGLWKVVYANECRARIEPLDKRHVELLDDDGKIVRSFEARQRGTDIAPHAFVEVVADLGGLERLAEEVKGIEIDLPKTQNVKVLKDDGGKAAIDKALGLGWTRTAKPATFKPGSLGERVMASIEANPGQPTAWHAERVTGGNVAACISRFNQDGLIDKGGK